MNKLFLLAAVLAAAPAAALERPFCPRLSADYENMIASANDAVGAAAQSVQQGLQAEQQLKTSLSECLQNLANVNAQLAQAVAAKNQAQVSTLQGLSQAVGAACQAMSSKLTEVQDAVKREKDVQLNAMNILVLATQGKNRLACPATSNRSGTLAQFRMTNPSLLKSR